MSKIFSLPHFSKTMNNLCKLTLLTDSFRQLDQKQSVDSFVLLFEVHITFGFQSEVPPLFEVLLIQRSETTICSRIFSYVKPDCKSVRTYSFRYIVTFGRPIYL